MGQKDVLPRISIIVPAYNVEAFIGESMASALAQTVPAYEIIAIDDGSDDATYKALEGFEAEPKVHLYCQANQGPGPTRNRGASLASGDYLYFFDADDRLDPHFVERIQETLVTGARPDVVLFSGESFTQSPELESYLRSYARSASGVGLGSVQAIKQLVKKRGSIHAAPYLHVISRQFWLASGLAYPDILYEDENVIMPLLFAASSITIIDEVLYYRRYRCDSTMTSTWDIAHVRGREQNLVHAIEMINRRPTSDRIVRKVLRDRCCSMAKDYVRRSKAVGCPVQLSLLLSAAIKSRSGKVLKKWLRQVHSKRAHFRKS